MLIPGYATPAGTARFRARFEAHLPGHFRQSNGLWISSIGLGTYLGDPTPVCDQLYADAVTRAAQLGVNHFDTAINYRHQRSERAVGQALGAMIAAGKLHRDEVVLATKGGFLTFDADEPEDPPGYFEEKLLRPGLVKPEDVAAGCHVMAPKFLAYQIDLSRHNLGVETLDIYYLHNPETQLRTVLRAEFYRRLRAAFAALEEAVAEEKIRLFGTATWNAYRHRPDSPEALSLAAVLRVAEEVGGPDHHFRAIQLPLNLAMPDALSAISQEHRGRPATALEVARAHGLMVFASASLMQGHLTRGLPEGIRERFPGLRTDAQCALQFVRSAPGITCALVGMSRGEHVEENLATAAVPPLSFAQFRSLPTG